MKRSLLFACLLLALFGLGPAPLGGLPRVLADDGPRVIVHDLLEGGRRADGLIYVRGETQPFTGRAVARREDGQKSREVEYRAGLPHGTWTEWHANGQKSREGEYQGGAPRGTWTEWHGDGRKKAENEYRNGVKEAWGLWNAAGQKTHEYHPEGKSIFWNDLGEVVQSVDMKGGLAHGKWIRRDTLASSGDPFKAEYAVSEGKLHGKWAVWDEAGQKWAEGEFDLGTPHGKWILWSESGLRSSEHSIREGRLHGEWAVWDEGGQKLMEGQYVRGVREGAWSKWDLQGRKVVRGEYEGGRAHGTWTEWHASGHRSVECHYEKGRLRGKWAEWYEDGQPRSEGYYVQARDSDRQPALRRWTTWNPYGEIQSEVDLDRPPPPPPVCRNDYGEEMPCPPREHQAPPSLPSWNNRALEGSIQAHFEEQRVAALSGWDFLPVAHDGLLDEEFLLAFELDKAIADSTGLMADLNQMTDNSIFGTGGLDASIANAQGGLLGSQYGNQFGSGGLGSRGSGFGGGGTAAGLGGLGTRGTGLGASGYGRGSGYYGKKGGGVPGVGRGSPIILGALDKSLIDRVVKSHLAQIRFCYERELNKNPKLFGKIIVKFVIGKNGSVSSATTKATTMKNSIVEQCVNKRFLRMKFPSPKGGGIVIVSYPFVFNPGEGSTPGIRGDTRDGH